MKSFRIKTSNNEDRIALLTMITGLTGIKLHDNHTPSTFVSQYSNYPVVNVYPTYLSGAITRKESDLAYPQDITKIIKALTAPKSITVEKVGDYDAVISSEGIVVGCQTISFKKLDEIVKAASSFR